jgi:hypothetical protein
MTTKENAKHHAPWIIRVEALPVRGDIVRRGAESYLVQRMELIADPFGSFDATAFAIEES